MTDDLLRFSPICSFYARVPVDGGQFRYDTFQAASSTPPDGFVPFLMPPAVGDTLLLWTPKWRLEPGANECGQYRVIERDWTYADYGSAAWPYGERAPKSGPRLTIIVELADGPFRNEAPEEASDA
jgi:hypothetical protein